MIGVFVQTNEGSRLAKHSPVGYVIEENGCWTWVGSRSPGGYGTVSFRGKSIGAHRMMYELHVGPIPDGMDLDHFVCETPSCVNPAHLRPVSTRENLLRGDTMASRRAAKTHCPRGHELSGDNLVAAGVAKGYRSCRTCTNDYSRRFMANRRSLALQARGVA